MEKAGTYGTQAELQAAASLLQVPVYIFQRPNGLRDWQRMVYSPQSKSQLDFSAYPDLHVVALQPPVIVEAVYYLHTIATFPHF